MKLVALILVTLGVVSPMTRMGCGGGSGPSDETETRLYFDCEYDHAFECNVFPNNNYTFVAQRFDEANTSLWPYFSDSIARLDPRDLTDILDITQRYCEKDIGGGREYDLYLGSVNSYGDTAYLGITLYPGQAKQAICMIFYERVVQYAYDNSLGESELRDGALIHELGHGRANLLHLCNGPLNINTTAHNRPNQGFTCIMADKFPKPSCLSGLDVASPLDNISFCGKCIDNLKKVNW